MANLTNSHCVREGQKKRGEGETTSEGYIDKASLHSVVKTYVLSFGCISTYVLYDINGV